MLKTLPLLIVSLLILSGCVDRAAADKKLAKGCAAGVEIFLDDGFKIKEITNTKFEDAPALGKGYRKVTINATISDDWYDSEETYQCIFIENIGLLNTNHSATIYQLRMREDEVYGNVGGKIVGGFDAQLKLTETVEQGMQ